MLHHFGVWSATGDATQMRWWLAICALAVPMWWTAGNALAQYPAARGSPSYGSRPPCSAVTRSPLAGAARGAAGGAIIGAISGNAGRGAAIGAGVRGVGAMVRRGSARSSGYCY
ncbi:MAG: glycine zipper family protein [Alphaproteobacteria bacterium]